MHAAGEKGFDVKHPKYAGRSSEGRRDARRIYQIPRSHFASHKKPRRQSRRDLEAETIDPLELSANGGVVDPSG